MSKCQWIFTKLGMCIDIKEIWFGIANGQILSMSSARNMIKARFTVFITSCDSSSVIRSYFTWRQGVVLLCNKVV